MKKLFIIIPLMVFVSLAFSDVIEVEQNSFSSDFEFRHFNGYDQVYYKRGEIGGIPGQPQLPSTPLHFLLPPDAIVDSVRVTGERRTIIAEDFNLYPSQPPYILPMAGVNIPDPQFTAPDPSAYGQNTLLPQSSFEYRKTGNLSGFKVASGIYYPLQYNPARGELYLLEKAVIQLFISRGGDLPAAPRKRSPNSLQSWQNFISNLVVNPETISNYYSHYFFPADGAYDYLIITDASLVPILDTLYQWKKQKGLRDTIITTAHIYSTMSGADNQTKIREFIKYAYTEWGITWVLLAGDVNFIPSRIVWAFDCEAGFYENENQIHADLYYSDLDGDWNLNGNDTYGEVADSVDQYPDVFVGRASLENQAEMRAWAHKLVSYEKTPRLDYLNKMLFLAMILWDDPYTDSGIAKDIIEELYVPDYYTITKLYESLGNETRETAIAAMNQGQAYINHDGHASWWVMGVGTQYLYPLDMDTLTNGTKQSVCYSIGCWPAAIDYDCISEHFIANPNGGGVAFFGNSRYGWGSPGNPGYGYSDVYDERVFELMYHLNIYKAGEILAFLKAYYAPYATLANIWRWHQYEINLLGDPEMQIWTNNPYNIAVSYPDSVPSFANTISICVEDHLGARINEAAIGLAQGETWLGTGISNFSGCTIMTIDPLSAEDVTLTVTGKNINPYQDALRVSYEGAYVNLEDYIINDTGGVPISGNTLAPTDSVILIIILKNRGSAAAAGLQAGLTPPANLNPAIIHFDYGDLAAAEICTLQTALSVSADGLNGEPAPIAVTVTDGAGSEWEYELDLFISTPVFSELSYSVISSGEDEIIQPGETATIQLVIKNSGPIPPLYPQLTLWTEEPYLSIPGGYYNITMISPDSGVSDPIDIQVHSSTPETYLAEVFARVSTSRGIRSTATFNLLIGNILFLDDMESGDDKWSHGGTLDMWQLTATRAHSGTYSWWCGSEASHQYQNGHHCYLKSDHLTVGDNPELSFWMYYEVSNYGVDGIYVDIIHEGDTTRHGFIGSGGALDSLLAFTVDWMEYRYDLFYIPPGDTIEVLFTMTSDDEDISTGFFIDDVRVTSQPCAFSLTTEEQSLIIDQFGVSRIFPNPFNKMISIELQLPQDDRVSLQIFDLMGRIIYREETAMERGVHTLTWDGSCKDNGELASGIYFVRISVNSHQFVNRILYLK
ncbi:T9SS type A sorting domain-containing protein [bacterium]|nr:T9SS type A sorting domain-containing protein [bacterium]